MNYIIGIVMGILALLFFSRKANTEASDAKINTLNGKIDNETSTLKQEQQQADELYKSYEEELKKLDPDFHDGTDGGNA